MGGALDREGAYLRFRLRGEELIREKGLIERVNSAFTVYIQKVSERKVLSF